MIPTIMEVILVVILAVAVVMAAVRVETGDYHISSSSDSSPIAMQEIARTNQNPKDEWRREAPPLIFWVLCP
ncbi:hypothetical protein VB774_02155 [Pseudanabaena galeata UHCC 0370]|uniref:Secreted protein n=1 Tax=Pseudanabaena galeata UHCC 0370 TaxID=3110310 RepID=A0ABU5TDR4_9CYAN|nr:hypothetical protein [Pseudanabaena galeata]MEA5476411.1 hypothetical protein [Pseudanabaena galeata UHCC 0370]